MSEIVRVKHSLQDAPLPSQIKPYLLQLLSKDLNRTSVQVVEGKACGGSGQLDERLLGREKGRVKFVLGGCEFAVGGEGAS